MPRTTTTKTQRHPQRRGHRQRRPPTSPVLPARPSTLTASPSPSRPRNDPIALPDLLTVDEVADAIRTSRPAVYALIRRGTLPGVIRLSRRILVDRTELVRWLDERRAVSPTQGVKR